MFYPNRQVLGDQLAEKASKFKNTDSIIFCLKRSSLLSCIELAADLHAYIYILQYSEIADPFDITRNLGAITQKGDFVLNPDISQGEYEYISMDFRTVIEERKREAFSRINSEADPNLNFNPAAFNNRNILLHAGFGGGIGVLIGHRGQHGGQYSHHQQYKKHQAMAQ